MSLFDKLTANNDDKATDVSRDEIDGDVSCTTCSNKVPANVTTVALYGELSDRSDHSHWIKVHHCWGCGFYSAFNFGNIWYPYDSILTTEDSSVEGIKQVESYAERLALFTLSQICYPQDDLKNVGRESKDLQSDNLSSFLPPGPNEIAKILWSCGKAVGFYTVKEKGAFLPPANEVCEVQSDEYLDKDVLFCRREWIPWKLVLVSAQNHRTQLSDCTFETYAMPMLDTMYVRKSMRRRGFAQRLVEDFICTNSGIDIGISDPISNGMLKDYLLISSSEEKIKFTFMDYIKGRKEEPYFLEKILQTDVGTRDRLWACSYTGEEGYRSNLWFLVRSKKS